MAQDSRGRVNGRVTDSSGGVLPNVEVIVTNVATGVKASGTTNTSGNYDIPFLQPVNSDFPIRAVVVAVFPEEDENSRRFVLTSLIENCHVRACDVEKGLQIPHRTVMNWMKQCRSEGPASFYRPPPASKPNVLSTLAPRVMTEDKCLECAQLIADGYPLAEVARRANIPESTLRKAHKRKAIPQLAAISVEEGEKKDAGPTGARVESTFKSERSREDAAAANAIGKACTRADERVAAANVLSTRASMDCCVGSIVFSNFRKDFTAFCISLRFSDSWPWPVFADRKDCARFRRENWARWLASTMRFQLLHQGHPRCEPYGTR